MAPPPTPGPAPTQASLYDAAITYLGRFATTEAGLLRVLERRIDRWRRAQQDPAEVEEQAAAARQAARAVVRRLADLGVVNDAAYAESKARGLIRSGVSRRAAAARLAAKGVGADQARAVLPDEPDVELAAALTLARRRRIGPFRSADADTARRQKEIAILARAGFPQSLARQALAMTAEEAETRIMDLRR